MATPFEPIGQHDLSNVDLTVEERELFDGPSLWDRFEPNLFSERDAFGAVVFMFCAIAHGALSAYAAYPPMAADHHMEAWRITAALLGAPFLFSLFFYQRFVGVMTTVALAVVVLGQTDMVTVDLEQWRHPARMIDMNWTWLNTRTFPLWIMVYGGLVAPIIALMNLFRRPSRKVLDARAKVRWEKLWGPEIRRRERLRLQRQAELHTRQQQARPQPPAAPPSQRPQPPAPPARPQLPPASQPQQAWPGVPQDQIQGYGRATRPGQN